MKTIKFLTDLKGLDQNDFDYSFAYTNRETGKSAQLFGYPLETVLKDHKVCISGYFMSLLGVGNTNYIQKVYGFTKCCTTDVAMRSCVLKDKNL